MKKQNKRTTQGEKKQNKRTTTSEKRRYKWTNKGEKSKTNGQLKENPMRKCCTCLLKYWTFYMIAFKDVKEISRQYMQFLWKYLIKSFAWTLLNLLWGKLWFLKALFLEYSRLFKDESLLKVETFRCVWWNQIHLTARLPQPSLLEDSGLPFVKIIFINEKKDTTMTCFNSECF